MKKKLHILFLFTAISTLFMACVKDIDFDQTDDIILGPVVALDFIFFNINSENFSDISPTNLIVTDTTFFDFLNEDFLVDNLIKADFYFKNKNSLPSQLITQYKFLDENNELNYEIIIPVNSGAINNPVITEYNEIIDEASIGNLTSSNKLVVNVIAPSPLVNFDGTLNLESKTTYYLRVEQ